MTPRVKHVHSLPVCRLPFGRLTGVPPARCDTMDTPISDKRVRALAKKSDHKWAHHVAVITSGRTIVAVGYNKGEIHAEQMAVRKMRFLGLEGTRLYSLRIRRDGRMGASRPCTDCEKIIRESGIKVIFYSGYDGGQERLILE